MNYLRYDRMNNKFVIQMENLSFNLIRFSMDAFIEETNEFSGHCVYYSIAFRLAQWMNTVEHYANRTFMHVSYLYIIQWFGLLSQCSI